MNTKNPTPGNTRSGKSIPYWAAALIIAIFFTGCAPVETRDDCISREPALEGAGAFYELIDPLKKEVWGTPDFTPDEYAAFSPPLLWQKNQPRTNMSEMVNGGNFLRSPGCPQPGQYTYIQAFDREFLNVVKLISMSQSLDGDGLIRESVLEKYHLLTYASGATIYILESPAGKEYIGVSRDVDRTSNTFTLPDGWNLTEHILIDELQIDLSGNVSVLRTDNEDSFQGPLPEGLSY